jgi:hypothetical protein
MFGNGCSVSARKPINAHASAGRFNAGKLRIEARSELSKAAMHDRQANAAVRGAVFR